MASDPYAVAGAIADEAAAEGDAQVDVNEAQVRTEPEAPAQTETRKEAPAEPVNDEVEKPGEREVKAEAAASSSASMAPPKLLRKRQIEERMAQVRQAPLQLFWPVDSFQGGIGRTPAIQSG